MGKRGPPPEPSILKYIRGNPGKASLNTNEPTPDLAGSDIEPPAWLDGVALQKWNTTAPVLASMRVLTVADIEPLARYCALWEQWKRNYDAVRAGLDVIRFKDQAGEIKHIQVSPYSSQMTKLATLLLRIEQEFGLTPSSRSQVTIHADRHDDPLSSFIEERRDSAGA